MLCDRATIAAYLGVDHVHDVLISLGALHHVEAVPVQDLGLSVARDHQQHVAGDAVLQGLDLVAAEEEEEEEEEEVKTRHGLKGSDAFTVRCCRLCGSHLGYSELGARTTSAQAQAVFMIRRSYMFITRPCTLYRVIPLQHVSIY